MTVLDRRNPYSAIPQLEKKIGSLTDYITVENGKVKISAKDLYLKGSEMVVSLEEVGMQYVDKDEIIAQINASEEGVLIAADKVNIQGAAIFSEYAKKEEASEDVQRIYYRTNTTSTPTAPTTWVTSTATANNTWTTKRMQYDKTYKYLFSCIQQKMADGEIENTAVLLDDTTTVIDGGNIITNTITLNQIAVATQGSILNSELDDDIEDAASKATTYIRNITGKGLCICRSATDNNNVLALTSGSVSLYADGYEAANFQKDGMRIYDIEGSSIASFTDDGVDLLSGKVYAKYGMRTGDSSSPLCVTTVYGKSTSVTGGNSSGAVSKTISKSGYLPIGIVGAKTGNGDIVFSRFDLTDISPVYCTATLTYNVRQVGGGSSSVYSVTPEFQILWMDYSSTI